MPEFNSAVLEYTAETTDDSNTVTATSSDPYASISIMLGETEIENGSAATWGEGDNVLTITVSGGAPDTTYTVTVTKS